MTHYRAPFLQRRVHGVLVVVYHQLEILLQERLYRVTRGYPHAVWKSTCFIPSFIRIWSRSRGRFLPKDVKHARSMPRSSVFSISRKLPTVFVIGFTMNEQCSLLDGRGTVILGSPRWYATVTSESASTCAFAYLEGCLRSRIFKLNVISADERDATRCRGRYCNAVETERLTETRGEYGNYESTH